MTLIQCLDLVLAIVMRKTSATVVKDEILVLSSYSVQPVEDGTMLTVQAATWELLCHSCVTTYISVSTVILMDRRAFKGNKPVSNRYAIHHWLI